MNLAEQMYEKSCKNRIKQLPMPIYLEIEQAVEQGYFNCEIYDIELARKNKDILEDMGFKVEYRVDETWGQIMGEYYYISWDKSKESDD